METKEQVLDKLTLENEVKIEPKGKKKSTIKFIHVFESDVISRPTKTKIKRTKIKHNLNRERRRLEKRWKESLSYYSLNPRKFDFGLKNL
jgi:hypothetical protein